MALEPRFIGVITGCFFVNKCFVVVVVAVVVLVVTESSLSRETCGN
jgi:hypothetical protein